MLTVAVGLSPRIGSVKWAHRRATVESASGFQVSLRDRGANRPAHPVFRAGTIVMHLTFIGTRAAAGPADPPDASASGTADSHEEERFHRIDEPRKMRNTRTGTGKLNSDPGSVRCSRVSRRSRYTLLNWPPVSTMRIVLTARAHRKGRAGLPPAPARCGTEPIDALQPILAEEWGSGVLIPLPPFRVSPREVRFGERRMSQPGRVIMKTCNDTNRFP